jgi:Cd2+/Zn2+-exporting ATPase
VTGLTMRLVSPPHISGLPMGARGSDAALEQADVVLMHDRLENFLAAFRLSQRARRVIRQNLFISLGTVVVLVTFALLGRIPLTSRRPGSRGKHRRWL